MSLSNFRPAPDEHHLRLDLRRSTPARPLPCSSKVLSSRRGVASHAWGDERALIDRAIRGDRDAQERLFAGRTPKLRKIAFSVLGNKEDAEDAVQDGLCRAYVKLGSFHGRSSFSTWLTRIIVNSALMTRRKLRALQETALEETVGKDAEPYVKRLVDPRPDPEHACALSETRQLVKKQVAGLTPHLQSAFRLRYVEHLSLAEAAKAEGANVNAIKSRVMRVRRHVATLLDSPRVNSWRRQLSLTGQPAYVGEAESSFQ